MKKLLLLFGTLFLLASCTKEETMTASRQPDKAALAPPIYGMAMLKNEAPATRGVANKLKVWNKLMAEDELTVRFLNGIPEYTEFVKEVAKEWEEVAGVRFHFLTDTNNDAMIRIGFDYVPGMQSSWSYTGTDHMYLLDVQDEPTMHFARWRRASDACKRSDVLRAFGQVLGLELEFRHPSFYPAWRMNDDGTIDEAYIRAYWEDELAEFISWEELKTMVLDPINVSARYIAKTDSYDQYSVMCWPFYERLALNISPIRFDSDYNTEFTASDISFIQSLYGEPLGPGPDVDEFFPLIEFNYTGRMPSFKVTTTKNLGVYWDIDRTEYTPIDLPANMTEFTTTISHTYANTQKRKIVIGEILGYGQTMPNTSSALTMFDFTSANGADSIAVKTYNVALETVWIRGSGGGFIPQDINFNANEYVKNIYLIGVRGSTVNVDNCTGLELLSTTPSLYSPLVVQPSNEGDDMTETAANYPFPPVIYDSLVPNPGPPELPVPNPDRPIIPRPLPWPYSPMANYSLGNATGAGIVISYCDNLTTISLDNTQIKNINFGNRPNLDYVYLSSESDYIVGGGTPKGIFLQNAISTLPSRANAISPGKIIVRGIETTLLPPPYLTTEDENTGVVGDEIPIRIPSKFFSTVRIDPVVYNQIMSTLSAKNWEIVWDYGVSTNIVN